MRGDSSSFNRGANQANGLDIHWLFYSYFLFQYTKQIDKIKHFEQTIFSRAMFGLEQKKNPIILYNIGYRNHIYVSNIFFYGRLLKGNVWLMFDDSSNYDIQHYTHHNVFLVSYVIQPYFLCISHVI